MTTVSDGIRPGGTCQHAVTYRCGETCECLCVPCWNKRHVTQESDNVPRGDDERLRGVARGGAEAPVPSRVRVPPSPPQAPRQVGREEVLRALSNFAAGQEVMALDETNADARRGRLFVIEMIRALIEVEEIRPS